MPSYSARSILRLTTRVHPDLQTLFNEVVVHYDCTIIGGLRTIEEQRSNVAKKLSQTMDSQHLPQADGLSHAIDAAPFPMPDDWDSLKARLELVYFAGKVMEIARRLREQGAISSVIRYGGDWNRNDLIADNGFMDLDHFEIAR